MPVTSTWPPHYKIKRHPRCRHVKLQASQKNGLELIVPLNFNLKQIPTILVKNKTWIEKQLLKLAKYELEIAQAFLPTTIYLRAINQTWNITYVQTNDNLKIITRPHFEIALVGDCENKTACQKLLVQWLKKLSKTHLVTFLDKICQETNLSYKKITIRDQKTRWGSCTKDKNISLNYKILFLPEYLAAHILIHELCHTVHLDHSEKFWNLVKKFDANWQANRNAIRQVNEFVPGWT